MHGTGKVSLMNVCVLLKYIIWVHKLKDIVNINFILNYLLVAGAEDLQNIRVVPILVARTWRVGMLHTHSRGCVWRGCDLVLLGVLRGSHRTDLLRCCWNQRIAFSYSEAGRCKWVWCMLSVGCNFVWFHAEWLLPWCPTSFGIHTLCAHFPGQKVRRHIYDFIYSLRVKNNPSSFVDSQFAWDFLLSARGEVFWRVCWDWRVTSHMVTTRLTSQCLLWEGGLDSLEHDAPHRRIWVSSSPGIWLPTQ